jgi:carboxyl-terminal processing protease
MLKVLRVLAAIVIGVSLGVLLALYSSGGFGPALSQDPADQLRVMIDSHYYKDVDPESIKQSKLKGVIKQLHKDGDKFTYYIPPKQLRAVESSLEGELEGIGVELAPDKRGAKIARVMPNGPAADAGLKKGEVITAVEGKSIEGKPLEFVVSQIRGPKDSLVTIELGQREIKLARAVLRISPVEARMIGNTAYLRLNSFTGNAAEALRRQLTRLYRRGAVNVVLDLRGNGGGLLDEAAEVGSIFINEGPIVSTDQGVLEAEGNALEQKPMVVLVDRYTASSSEILAAALEEAGYATLVGERTFGKGSFQELMPLSNGGMVALTVGYYKTRNGNTVTDKGLAPSIQVKDNPKTLEDEALKRALRQVR